MGKKREMVNPLKISLEYMFGNGKHIESSSVEYGLTCENKGLIERRIMEPALTKEQSEKLGRFINDIILDNIRKTEGLV